MALQVAGLFTSIIAAIVAPRNTSSDSKRAGLGVLIWVGAAAFMVCPVPTLWVFRPQRKEESVAESESKAPTGSSVPNAETALPVKIVFEIAPFPGNIRLHFRTRVAGYRILSPVSCVLLKHETNASLQRTATGAHRPNRDPRRLGPLMPRSRGHHIH